MTYKFTKEVKQLRQLKRLVKDGSKQDALQLADALYTTIKDKPIQYVIEIRDAKRGGDKAHLQAYINAGKRFKNIALSDMQDIRMAITAGNATRCNTVVKQLIDTRFHSVTCLKAVHAWKPLVYKSICKEVITI